MGGRPGPKAKKHGECSACRVRIESCDRCKKNMRLQKYVYHLSFEHVCLGCCEVKERRTQVVSVYTNGLETSKRRLLRE